jgi:GNAT superfamily N-acetyltransferase
MSVRPAVRADIGVLADVLARAFHDDPTFTWVLPDDEARHARIRRVFATTLRVDALRRGMVDVAWDHESGAIAGGAIWYPPGAWPSPALRQFRALPGYVGALGRKFGPTAKLSAAMARAHPRSAHWYLASVGVAPAHQGKGVGGALLRARLARVDQSGAAAYLESSKIRNIPLYEHFGFTAGDVPPLPAGAPVVTPMSRPVLCR